MPANEEERSECMEQENQGKPWVLNSLLILRLLAVLLAAGLVLYGLHLPDRG